MDILDLFNRKQYMLNVNKTSDLKTTRKFQMISSEDYGYKRTEAVAQRCSVKKVFLEISPATLLKKRL